MRIKPPAQEKANSRAHGAQKAYALPVSARFAKQRLSLLSRRGAGDTATLTLPAASTKDSFAGWRVCQSTFYHQEKCLASF